MPRGEKQPQNTINGRKGHVSENNDRKGWFCGFSSSRNPTERNPRNPEIRRNPGQARIDDLLSEVAFVGGCAVGLLITDEAAPAIRPTRDVDVIVEIGSYQEYDAPGVAGHGLEDEDRAVAPCRSHFSGTGTEHGERRFRGVPLKRDLHWPLKLACRFLEAYLPASGW